MKKIEINEGCFGHDVLINDESLFTHEYDNRSPELISGLQSTTTFPHTTTVPTTTHPVSFLNSVLSKISSLINIGSKQNSTTYQPTQQCPNNQSNQPNAPSPPLFLVQQNAMQNNPNSVMVCKKTER